MIEFVALPEHGRRFSERYKVRLGDVSTDGSLRLDGVARLLQDVATDDWDETELDSNDIWVVRRTAVRLAAGGRWPQYKELMTITTWCGGVGAAWAERRTNFEIDGELLLEASAIWVPIDPSGHPMRIGPTFFEVYGEAIRGRKVSGRVRTPEVSPEAQSRPWPLRRADLDVIGHVNNAAVWQAVTEVTPDSARYVEVTHHGSLEQGGEVTLLHTDRAMWLVVDGVVQVAAEFSA
ncbi:MAG TPA: acyl-ACP thioesterase domain-containing protein [Acidimicrobiales bacterium]|nr:acyl-ACP thioesterase domain-containing protein [Acidimicrobiales bacterium]